MADGCRKRNDRSVKACSQIEKQVKWRRRGEEACEQDPSVIAPWEGEVRNKKGVVVTHRKTKERKTRAKERRVQR